MASKRIAVVTGGNKGIGLEICKQLASSGVLVVLGARDQNRGVEAVERLKNSGVSEVVFHQLDITDIVSINSLVDFIKTQFGKLDILVNNAGVFGANIDEEAFTSLNLQPGEITGAKAERAKEVMQQTYETAERCLGTNYYGTKQVTRALLPLLKQSNSPRIVNMSSGLGQLEKIKHEKTSRIFSDADGLTEEVVDEVVKGFLQDAKDGVLETKGWNAPLPAYCLSKAGLNAYTRVLAKKHPSFRINAVSPGFVKTDMTHHQGKYTAEEGARGPVKLALIPDNGPSGCYFFQTEEQSF